MKAIYAAVFTLLMSAVMLQGQSAVTNEEPAVVPKADIQALLKLPAFTNNVGMVMVRVSPRLWISKYLVTQQEYKAVTKGNPSKFIGDRNPVDTVSWNDALSFCAKLTETEREAEMLPPGFTYKLPTQAQWESISAGVPDEQAVTSKSGSRNSTMPVGSLAPNSLGLHDVRGNLWQFCRDPDDKPFRVLRGAAWNTSLEMNLRREFRWYANGPDERREIFGFRCVLAP